MCSALRFCLSVYFDLSPWDMTRPPAKIGAQETPLAPSRVTLTRRISSVRR